jgi:Icc-related predicted phosphoesterase
VELERIKTVRPKEKAVRRNSDFFFVFTIILIILDIMRIVCISDTHSLEKDIVHPIPEGDVLIHAGDISNKGGEKDVTNFIHWFQNINGFDTKIFISGNHDHCFEQVNKPHHKRDYDWLRNLMAPENLAQSNVYYLEDNFMTIEDPEFSRPIKFYGSPWQPWFYDWAFNLPRLGDEIEQKWKMIPDDTDVLITHGPPNEILDLVNNFRQPNRNVGCELLRFHVERVKPALNVFGHIHEGYGTKIINDTLFVNASICNPSYYPINKPIIVDLVEVGGKIIANYINE